MGDRELSRGTREAITHFLFIGGPLQPVDLVIVLGGSSIKSMDPAIEMYNNEMTDRLLISGAGPTRRRAPEWEHFRDYAISKGIPITSMLIETEARNTYENMTNSNAIIAKTCGWSSIRRIAISTQPIHSRRALMTAARVFPPEVEIILVTTSDISVLQPETWWQSRSGRLIVLEEIRKIGEYGVRGDLGDF